MVRGSRNQAVQAIGVQDRDRAAVTPNQASFAKLTERGTDRLSAAANEISHFLMGELDTETDTGPRRNSVGLF